MVSTRKLPLRSSYSLPGRRQTLRRIVGGVVLLLMLSTAAPARAAETFHMSFKGLFADAFFHRVDGCIETSVDVFGEDGRTSGPGHPTASSDAFLFIEQINLCNDTRLLDALGAATLSAEEFKMNRKLSAASLFTTITVQDSVGGSSFPVDVEVSWRGRGATSREIGHFHIKTHEYRSALHSNGVFREGTASGRVLVGARNLTPEPAVFTLLGNVKTGEVAIIH
jgi:hypothetical protein